MSSSDPIMFAARAARMSDQDLLAVETLLIIGETLDDFQQAMLDELRIRRRQETHAGR